MKIMTTLLLSFAVLLNLACDKQEINGDVDDNDTGYAIVEKVTASGSEGNYSFSVTLKSPDKGCNQYANWWEVVSVDGELIYRRILGHSHVNEQPFTRSGGSVNISADQIVIIRGHMNTSGYGDGKITLKGNVNAGFEPFETTNGFASDIEDIDPQPTGCAF